MSIADKLLGKLAEVNTFAAHYKKRLSETFALPTVLEMRAKSLKEAKVQVAYWTQRQLELETEIAEKEERYRLSMRWLDDNKGEFEKIEDIASDKAQKLGSELAELLRNMSAGSNSDEENIS